MIVPRTAVKQRTSVMVLALILLVFGVYSYNTLPRESAPDISIPYVFVSTDYAGVAAADIETSITIPIEKKLRGMRGVKRLQSISSEGLSQINVEFLPDVDINDALQDVRNKVDEAKGELPADLEDDPWFLKSIFRNCRSLFFLFPALPALRGSRNWPTISRMPSKPLRAYWRLRSPAAWSAKSSLR
jgi:multidrug efflux pump subunit AcrB